MKIDQKSLIWLTPGQSGAKNLLNNFLRESTKQDLPHAFLFLGPSGVGKTLLAKEFAQKISALNSTNKDEEKSVAEILEFDFADSGSVENLRELMGFTSLTSANNSRKIFLLKNFDLASVASSNIMLKTLEEPPASSMFILVANSNGVLPTVMSRCIRIRCFPVADLKVNSNLPQNLVTIVSEYPELLQRLENDPEKTKVVSELLNKLQDRHLGLMNLNSLIDLETEDLKLLIKLWIHSLKQHLGQDNKPEMLATIIHNLKVAQNTNEDLQRSYNTKLVLQQFIIQTH